MQFKSAVVIGISLWVVAGVSCAQLPPVESRTAEPARAVPTAPVAAPTTAGDAVVRQQMLEMVERVDLMEREIRQLRNEVELLNHELNTTKSRQRELYLDIDRRLRKLEQGAASHSPTPPRASAPAPATDAASTATDAPTVRSQAPTPEEQSAYRNAFNLLKERRYPQAIAAFEGFLKTYPNGYYADNARYWLGEANYVTQNYQAAVDHFQRVLSDFPDSAKIADALLKIGFSYYELKQWDKARQSLQAVSRRFPDGASARLAEARLKRMQEEGH